MFVEVYYIGYMPYICILYRIYALVINPWIANIGFSVNIIRVGHGSRHIYKCLHNCFFITVARKDVFT